jgi:hypothetical protein
VSVLRALRLLILGETWTLPAGVLVVLLACAALREAAPDVWDAAGGVLLVGGVVAVLVLAVARGARPPRA